MRYLYSFLIIGLVYSSVVGIGIFVGTDMIHLMYETGEIAPMFEEPESLTSSAQMFIYVVLITALLLFLIKYKLDIVIKLMLVMAMLVGMVITFRTFFGIYFELIPAILIALIPAVCLLILNLWRKSILIRNLVLVFAISGVGAILGASLGIIPALCILIIFSAYDIIAVFGTKHMITLADALQPKPKQSTPKGTEHATTQSAEDSEGGIPFMFTLPFGDHDIELGTGDFAIPCMFAVSVLRDARLMEYPSPELHAIVTAIGGLVGVMALFIYIMKKEHVALPALPPISAGLILGLGLSLLIL
ncbi:MAG: hypothetical protein A7316_09660 [Candidatus Altiarchaeales archaeon WOR_SM1_86-2]|nr:MAG: hypothetical protein A7316_09660 [Candidatus Altiarchaeales archaeon WOR_SM1_86-2]